MKIVALDCCEHVLARLHGVADSHLLARSSTDLAPHANPDLIVIGIARYPVRRLFISQLRRVYRNVPIAILRREVVSAAAERIACEFILGEQDHRDDCATVRAVRRIMPFDTCHHLQRTDDYDIVRELIRILASKYADPKLNLSMVAKELPISPKRLSMILNRSIGLNFRQLLRQVRIEEAKGMLAMPQHSVKQIAVLVGFADNHYFSRSFKELTGQSASEYRQSSAILS